MKKKIILVNISKSCAEIDWILPLLYKLKDEFYIFTLFQSNEAYETLVKDKILFDIWKGINFDHAIDTKFDKYQRYIKKKLNVRFNFKKYLKKKKIFFDDIALVFSEFGTYSWLVDEFKFFEVRPKTIHFPTSSYIFGKEKNAKINYSLKGDYLFLCNKLDINFWEKRIDKRKIKIVGVPKYDKFWIEKITINKNKIKKPSILLAYSSRFDLEKKDNKKLETQLIEILDVLKNFPNHEIVFKVHPKKNNPYYLEIFKKFKNLKIEVSNENLLKLTNECDVLVHDKLSSVIYEGLSLKKPCVEYWSVVNNKDPDYIYAHDELELNIKATNSSELSNLINLAVKEPNNLIWKKQQSNYLSINHRNTENSANKTATLCKEIMSGQK